MYQVSKILFAFIFLMFWNTSNAQEHTFTSSVYSVYLGGNGAIFYDGPVSQSKLFSQWDSGVYTQVWASISSGTEGDFGNEGDFKVGYSGNSDRLNYSIDVQYLAVHGIDVYNLNGEISFGPLFARVEAYRPMKSSGPRKGFLNFLGVRNTIALTSKTTLSLQQQVLYDTGPFGLEKGWLTMTHAGLNFDVGENDGVVITTGLVLSLPLSVNDREKEWAANLGLVYHF